MCILGSFIDVPFVGASPIVAWWIYWPLWVYWSLALWGRSFAWVVLSALQCVCPDCFPSRVNSEMYCGLCFYGDRWIAGDSEDSLEANIEEVFFVGQHRGGYFLRVISLFAFSLPLGVLI
ncbi:hypothetical protein SUGI_1161710 [Cryptomeria japonica]|nr:hypothetical protein SUGI_1161710 [Cryptomeria japonica]